MSALAELAEYDSLGGDYVFYVAHPVKPTDDDVARFRAYEAELADSRRRQVGVDSVGLVPERVALEAIIRKNIVNAKAWRALLARRFPTITFIVPWVAALDGGGDDDLDPQQRSRGIRDCCRTVAVCHGIVLVGGRVSGGMAEEAYQARRVVDLTYLGAVPPTTLEV